jgi:uncharacterized membrane protein (UPF0127 family)
MRENGVRAFNQDRQTEVADSVTVADTFLRRLRGWLGRSEVRKGEGLWIVPSRAVHTRGMGFPIDVLFLDRSFRVVAAKENMHPGRMTRVWWKARTVLELPAGTLQRTGTCVGDRIQMKNPKECS